jgi:glycosyltransferase involved in cell wall biosynthesis
VIIVDSGSTDKTIKIANSYQAKIVRISHSDFSYSYSLNVAIESAKSENLAIYSAHSLPVYNNALKIAAGYLKYDKVAGAYGPCLADNDASLTERAFYFPGLIRLYRSAQVIERPRMGVLGNTNSFIKKSFWQSHPFDLSMGEGGEDIEWASYWLKQAKKIILDPKLAVYHSHGLSFVKFIDQYKHWQKVYKQALAKYE